MARKLTEFKLKSVLKGIEEIIEGNSDDSKLNSAIMEEISKILNKAVIGNFVGKASEQHMIENGQIIPSKGIFIPRPDEKRTKKTQSQVHIRQKGDSERADAIKGKGP